MTHNTFEESPAVRRIDAAGPAFYRMSSLPEVLGVGRSTLYEWIKAGYFPAPVKLGPKAVGFRTEDIRAWMATRCATKSKDSPLSAPAFAENGLPIAYIVKEAANRYHVQCPYCGDIHYHGAGVLGSRMAHCGPKIPDRGHYELMFPNTEVAPASGA
jgi:prophage regulatory protein